VVIQMKHILACHRSEYRRKERAIGEDRLRTIRRRRGFVLNRFMRKGIGL
jgi:hypothetical protein